MTGQEDSGERPHPDLITKLEQAAGPDREIDVEIGRLQGVLVGKQDRETGEVRDFTYHHYTESIDSALTLFPDGWEWALFFECGEYRVETGDPMLGIDTEHAHAAIAICIAALKARAKAA